MSDRSTLVRSSALAVRLAILANGAFGLAIGVGLVVSLVLVGRFTVPLLGLAPVADATTGVRCLMLVGLVGAATVHCILVILGRIVASVAEEDPFVEANAARLRQIAWALLVFQLLDFPIMAIRHAFPSLGDAAPDPGLSIGGWLAVLMMFVLARVFATGTSMRDYLRETI